MSGVPGDDAFDRSTVTEAFSVVLGRAVAGCTKGLAYFINLSLWS